MRDKIRQAEYPASVPRNLDGMSSYSDSAPSAIPRRPDGHYGYPDASVMEPPTPAQLDRARYAAYRLGELEKAVDAGQYSLESLSGEYMSLLNEHRELSSDPVHGSIAAPMLEGLLSIHGRLEGMAKAEQAKQAELQYRNQYAQALGHAHGAVEDLKQRLNDTLDKADMAKQMADLRVPGQKSTQAKVENLQGLKQQYEELKVLVGQYADSKIPPGLENDVRAMQHALYEVGMKLYANDVLSQSKVRLNEHLKSDLAEREKLLVYIPSGGLSNLKEQLESLLSLKKGERAGEDVSTIRSAIAKIDAEQVRRFNNRVSISVREAQTQVNDMTSMSSKELQAAGSRYDALAKVLKDAPEFSWQQTGNIKKLKEAAKALRDEGFKKGIPTITDI